MTAGPRPRITVAIPLHRSEPFVDLVSNNINRIADQDVEILVSDRTQQDNALGMLRARHGADRRIAFRESSDGAGWVDHYNSLLRLARGRYFMWMAHDDDFPTEYLPLLSSALDDHPEALLAFGSLRPVDLDGEPVAVSYLPELPIPLGGTSRADEVIALLQRWNLAIPSRGLFRRDEILRRRLTIRHTPGEVDADAHWVLAVAAAGPIVFQADCSCDKRVLPESGSSQWARHRHSVVGQLAVVPLTARYLIAARVPLGDTARIMRFVTVRAVQRSIWMLPAGVRAPFPRSLRRAASRLLTKAQGRPPSPTDAD